MELFSIVNEAALISNDWESFRSCYSILFHRRLAGSPELARYLAHAAAVLTHRGDPVTAVADSGMQGTFALALAASIEDLAIARPEGIDIRLAVVYPWLLHVFRGRAASCDAQLLLALENRYS